MQLERALDELGGGTFDCSLDRVRMLVGHTIAREVLELIGAMREENNL